MSISAKELAKKLNISEAAVSLALNGKPGVSTQTRNLVIETAHNLGYDFTKIKPQSKIYGTILFLIYRKHGIIINDNPFFNSIIESVQTTVKNNNFKFSTRYIFDGDDVKEQLDSIIDADTVGLILLGTEMSNYDFGPFAYLNIPIVLLDTYFNSVKMDCVVINNVEGAYQATHFLLKKRNTQPGYLHSSYPIYNFEERAYGFYKAIKDYGLSRQNSIVHTVAPSMNGTYADLKTIISSGEKLANCYFADNNLIAAGAIKAFKEAGYNIPKDIAIIAFDNTPICSYVEPSITAVNVPAHYMGKIAAERIIHVIESKEFSPLKIEINTNIIKRHSI